MKFSIARETILRPLQLINGVVERRQTLPILSNILIKATDSGISLTGTDLEIELQSNISVEGAVEVPGIITVPAKKLFDICKSLPDSSTIRFTEKEGKVVVQAGRSRFTLSTLPAAEFPKVESDDQMLAFEIPRHQLKRLIGRAAYAMANNDVRYYLNGLLMELAGDKMRAVATDGHRLATCETTIEHGFEGPLRAIVPHKGIVGLGRLLDDSDTAVSIGISSYHLTIKTGEFEYTSKLVDGKFPDYQRVIPRNTDKIMVADRIELREVLSRASILSSEKYRGVKLVMDGDSLEVSAENQDSEEADDGINISYQGTALEIGFNVTYLIDALDNINSEKVQFSFSDANGSAMVQEFGEETDTLAVLMPMRLN